MKKNIMTSNRKHQQGFTIIEVMVAMVIGLILMAGVFNVFISSKESQEIISDQVELVDESRIVLEMLSYDIKRSGLWGKTNYANQLIENAASFDAVRAKLALANDCVNAKGNSNVQGRAIGWALDVFKVVFSVSEEDITANGFPYTKCISGVYLRGDILEVRYAGEKILKANLDAKTVYIISQGQFSDLFYGASPTQPQNAVSLYGTNVATDPPITYHKYESVLYYVSKWTDGTSATNDGIPSLRRVSLQTGPALVDEVVLTGVENLQLQFGMDMDNNIDTQSVQRYLDPDSIVSNANTNEWSMVKSIQIWALVRSKQSRSENLAQKFYIPAIPVAPVGTPPTNYTTAADGYKRVMVSSVNKVRNLEFVDGK